MYYIYIYTGNGLITLSGNSRFRKEPSTSVCPAQGCWLYGEKGVREESVFCVQTFSALIKV